jgi:hypothetical protein
MVLLTWKLTLLLRDGHEPAGAAAVVLLAVQLCASTAAGRCSLRHTASRLQRSLCNGCLLLLTTHMLFWVMLLSILCHFCTSSALIRLA